ncbi:hypothetical protein [Rosistilla ulvae]|nr:hypothetical protein [Rosistilla ulvae]
MSNTSSEPTASSERAMPQWSLRFLMLLVTLSAMLMWVFRAAIIENVFWAQCVAVVLATAIGCFAMYALAFALASLFASMTGSILQPTRSRFHPPAVDQRDAAEEPQ